MSNNNEYSRPDHYTKKAKAQGFAARSVFKLEEIHQRHRIFQRGDAVIDLGCAPGSWSRYANQRTGEPLVGVDLVEVKSVPGTFLLGSVFDITPEALLAPLGRRADVILSDMAPLTTGDRFGDHVRQIELARRGLELARQTGRPGATFVVKIFDGEDAPALLAELRAAFTSVKRLKPDATRDRSVEFFAIGLGLRQVEGL